MMARRRNYKRDGRGRFARVASRAGKSYVRGKSRRVDARKARMGTSRPRKRISQKRRQQIALGVTVAQIALPIVIAGASGSRSAIAGRAASQNARRASSANAALRGISARGRSNPYIKASRAGVYKITSL